MSVTRQQSGEKFKQINAEARKKTYPQVQFRADLGEFAQQTMRITFMDCNFAQIASRPHPLARARRISDRTGN
ncbi:MAG: hypothetical protein ACPG61_14465 [Paracoccaceae bacterium]